MSPLLYKNVLKYCTREQLGGIFILAELPLHGYNVSVTIQILLNYRTRNMWAA
jgi:hypothetical protein